MLHCGPLTVAVPLVLKPVPEVANEITHPSPLPSVPTARALTAIEFQPKTFMK
jgi:hypothetical protein